VLSVHLICVGKLKEKFYQDACAEYQKRLSAFCRLTVTELPEEKLPERKPSPAQIAAALEKEAAAVRAKIPPSSRIAALCVEGRLRSSEELAQMLRAGAGPDKHLVFLIGGSRGLHPALKAEAQLRLSMSPMTFPHHLARVMLLEQLYRAFQINAGSPYHK